MLTQFLARITAALVARGFHDRISTLEVRMDNTRAAITELAAATTRVGDRLNRLIDEAVANDRIDDELAAQVRAQATFLDGLGNDPENPVPNEPTDPEDGGETPTDPTSPVTPVV